MARRSCTKPNPSGPLWFARRTGSEQSRTGPKGAALTFNPNPTRTWPVDHGVRDLEAEKSQVNIARTGLINQQAQVAMKCVPWLILKLIPKLGDKIGLDGISTVPSDGRRWRLRHHW